MAKGGWFKPEGTPQINKEKFVEIVKEVNENKIYKIRIGAKGLHPVTNKLIEGAKDLKDFEGNTSKEKIEDLWKQQQQHNLEILISIKKAKEFIALYELVQ